MQILRAKYLGLLKKGQKVPELESRAFAHLQMGVDNCITSLYMPAALSDYTDGTVVYSASERSPWTDFEASEQERALKDIRIQFGVLIKLQLNHFLTEADKMRFAIVLIASGNERLRWSAWALSGIKTSASPARSTIFLHIGFTLTFGKVLRLQIQAGY